MSDHAYATTNGLSYLDRTFSARQLYVSRYFHFSRHYVGWRAQWVDSLINVVAAIVAPVIGLAVLLIDLPMNTVRFAKTLPEMFWIDSAAGGFLLCVLGVSLMR